MSTNNLDVSGRGFIRDLSTNNLDVNGRGYIRDLSANNLDVSGRVFIRDLSTNNLDVSGRGFIRDLSSTNLSVSGFTTLRDTSLNGNLSVSGTITGAVTNAVITDISANDGKKYYPTFVDGSGNKPLYINSFNTLAYRNQSLGIGTDAPTNSLDVSGSATILRNINFGNTTAIVARTGANCVMNVMTSSVSPSVTDIYFRANPTSLAVVFDLSFNSWGTDNVNLVLDINFTGKAAAVSQGGPFIVGKEYVSNTSGGTVFDTFVLNGLSRKDCVITLSSPSNYRLRILFQPTNSSTFVSGTLRVINGSTSSNIADINMFLQ